MELANVVGMWVVKNAAGWFLGADGWKSHISWARFYSREDAEFVARGYAGAYAVQFRGI
jgi:hypothetical protein